MAQSLGLALVALIGFSLAACDRFASPGYEFVLQANPEQMERASGDGATPDQLVDESIEVLRQRLEAMDVHLFTAVHEGGGRVALQTASRDDAEKLRAALARRGELDFKLVDDSIASDDLFAGVAPPGGQILKLADGSSLAIRRLGGISGSHIVDAQVGISQQTEDVVINIALDEDGGRKLAQLSRTNVGNRMAVVLDGEILMAPVIYEPILGGALQVSGGFTLEEAAQIAASLRSGPLPLAFNIVEERPLD